MRYHEFEQQACSCICVSLLVIIWLVAGAWPDPTYIAVKVNDKKIDAMQAQVQTLQTLMERTLETLNQPRITSERHGRLGHVKDQLLLHHPVDRTRPPVLNQGAQRDERAGDGHLLRNHAR